MAEATTTPAGTALNPVDGLADTVVTVLSGLANNVEAPVIDSEAEAAEPFLAWPIIKQIFEGVVSDLTGDLAVIEEEGVLKIVYVIQADSRLYTLGQAMLALQKAKQGGNPNDISTATQAAAGAWGSIIHDPGFAPVAT